MSELSIYWWLLISGLSALGGGFIGYHWKLYRYPLKKRLFIGISFIAIWIAGIIVALIYVSVNQLLSVTLPVTSFILSLTFGIIIQGQPAKTRGPEHGDGSDVSEREKAYKSG